MNSEFMENSVKIRKLISDIDKKLQERESYNFYGILNYIIIKMEDKYNLQDYDVISQLELILISLGGVVSYE